MANKFELPNDPKLAEKALDFQSQETQRRQDMGLFGTLFGGISQKPGNIAGFAVVASFALFACVMILGTDSGSLSRKDALLIVAGFISLSLGFLFGNSSKD